MQHYSTVEVYTGDEFDAACALCIEGANFSLFRSYKTPVNKAVVALVLEDHVDEPGKLVTVVYEDKIPVGVVLGSVSSMDCFQGLTVATEPMLHITKCKDKDKVLGLLLDAYEEWARTEEVDVITAGVYTNSNHASTYLERGFRPSTTTMYKRVS